MFASEDYIQIDNDGKRWNCGESGVYEVFTDDVGRLFRSLQHEHGRCKGSVMVTRSDEDIKVGWVFEKRRRFTDCDETYLAETWVTLHDSMPETTIKYNLHTL
jgi:hypothetical protein